MHSDPYFAGSRIELAQEGDMEGRWDEHRVAQALSNLMSSAIKYGAADAPVSVTLDGTTTDEVVVAVHNQGAEIPLETLESLFQPLGRHTWLGDRANEADLSPVGQMRVDPVAQITRSRGR